MYIGVLSFCIYMLPSIQLEVDNNKAYTEGYLDKTRDLFSRYLYDSDKYIICSF